ncbi:MAG TPA: alkaline phosphatase family protein [Micromonosporaceae bacterium]
MNGRRSWRRTYRLFGTALATIALAACVPTRPGSGHSAPPAGQPGATISASLPPGGSGTATTRAPSSGERSGPSRWPAVKPDHIVVVILENKAPAQIDANPAAPYLNALMRTAAVLTGSRAVTHPSQPNYLALFSGSTQDVDDDHCLGSLGNRPNLGRQLLDTGRTFVGYSEGLPAVGFTGCSSGRYAAKHNPWKNFANLPSATNQPATAFPSDFSRLPTVAFVVPDLCHDMHDCSVATGDAWLREHLDAYARWAAAHNSLLVVTFDEDDKSAGNHILTFLVGAPVWPGRYGQPVDHYGLLATMEDLYGLGRLGRAASATALTGIWR